MKDKVFETPEWAIVLLLLGVLLGVLLIVLTLPGVSG